MIEKVRQTIVMGEGSDIEVEIKLIESVPEQQDIVESYIKRNRILGIICIILWLSLVMVLIFGAYYFYL